MERVWGLGLVWIVQEGNGERLSDLMWIVRGTALRTKNERAGATSSEANSPLSPVPRRVAKGNNTEAVHHDLLLVDTSQTTLGLVQTIALMPSALCFHMFGKDIFC